MANSQKLFAKWTLPVWGLSVAYTGLVYAGVNLSGLTNDTFGGILENIFRFLYIGAGLSLTALVFSELLNSLQKFGDSGPSAGFLANLALHTFVNILWFSFFVAVSNNLLPPLFIADGTSLIQFQIEGSFSGIDEIVSKILLVHIDALSFGFLSIVGGNDAVQMLAGKSAMSRFLFWLLNINITIIFVDAVSNLLFWLVGRRKF